MIIDEEKPKPPASLDATTAAPGADLSRFSLFELQNRVQALHAEIARTEAEISKKQAQSDAAAALFKK